MLPTQENFLNYIDDWMAKLPDLAASDIFTKPNETALISVDMIEGFCRQGNLASSRIEGIIPAITALMRKGWDLGLRDIVLMQDCHTADAREFGAYAPHAVCGTAESETIKEYQSLPFFGQVTLFTKNSVDSLQNTGLGEWISQHPNIKTFIIAGNCTDICIFQLATSLRFRANTFNLDLRVIVPEPCVQTYDYPVEAALKAGGIPHDGDLLHKVFLYEMALNGVEVVKAIK